jgi:hypothetical protein
MRTETPTVLDVIADVTRSLRYSGSFCAQLRPLDEAAARRVVQRYIAFLFEITEGEPKPTD